MQRICQQDAGDQRKKDGSMLEIKKKDGLLGLALKIFRQPGVMSYAVEG
jgi:hypothetical protein